MMETPDLNNIKMAHACHDQELRPSLKRKLFTENNRCDRLELTSSDSSDSQSEADLPAAKVKLNSTVDDTL